MKQKKLGTREERVKLLKAGILGKEIERLYIAYNDLHVIDAPILYNL